MGGMWYWPLLWLIEVPFPCMYLPWPMCQHMELGEDGVKVQGLVQEVVVTNHPCRGPSVWLQTRVTELVIIGQEPPNSSGQAVGSCVEASPGESQLSRLQSAVGTECVGIESQLCRTHFSHPSFLLSCVLYKHIMSLTMYMYMHFRSERVSMYMYIYFHVHVHVYMCSKCPVLMFTCALIRNVHNTHTVNTLHHCTCTAGLREFLCIHVHVRLHCTCKYPCTCDMHIGHNYMYMYM